MINKDILEEIERNQVYLNTIKMIMEEGWIPANDSSTIKKIQELKDYFETRDKNLQSIKNDPNKKFIRVDY